MNFALFESTIDSGSKQSFLFTRPVTTIEVADSKELTSAFNLMLDYQKQGFYLAGYIAYDAIFAMEPKLSISANHSESCPILKFTVFECMDNFAACELSRVLTSRQINIPAPHSGAPLIEMLELGNDFEAYQDKFNKVISHLNAGDSYQVNLTLNGKVISEHLSPFDLYYLLSRQQPVAYAAYLPNEVQTIVSLSPELFFRKEDDKITVRPMKGTSSRGSTQEEDQANYTWLRNDSKNLAENLIIVDLLRNDLAKLCKTGTVRVKELFTVEVYTNLYQMTSQVTAKVESGMSLEKILIGLFPCGSITGAPKLRTMQLIDEIEGYRRGVYSGAIGFVLPDNNMCFSVAIRTLTCLPDQKEMQFGVGGGITINSQAAGEWKEIWTKLRFITRFYQPDFKLVESMLLKNGKVVNLDRHLKRLYSSASRLGFVFNEVSLNAQVSGYLKEKNLSTSVTLSYKLRLEYDYEGKVFIEHQLLNQPTPSLNVAVLAKPINTSHPLFKHKTTSSRVRGLYEQLYQEHKPGNIDELLFVNQDLVVTESRFFNVVVRHNDRLLTPPVAAGLLPGIYRQRMLEQQQFIEEPITLDMLNEAQEIYLCNDVRGLIRCNYSGSVG